ncbi:SdpI family protein [bacterium]|nr:SdpI family protein [bacterium]
MEIQLNPLFITLGSCGLIFIVMGFIMSKKPPREINGLYGYRTPRAMKNQKNWDYAQVYSAKVMMKYGGYFLLLCLPGYLMDIAPEEAAGVGLIVLLIGVAFMIFQVETHLKKWESKNKE